MTEYEKSMQKEIEEFAKKLIAVAEQKNKRTLTAKEIKQIQDFAESWIYSLPPRRE